MATTLTLGGWLFLAGAWLAITGLSAWCLARLLATKGDWGGERDDARDGCQTPGRTRR